MTVIRILACVVASVASAVGAEPKVTNAVGTLRGTVLDAETWSPMPCTVSLVDSAGQKAIENQSFTEGFRSNGRFEKTLPAGKARIRVSRGLEYRAVEQVVEIPAGGVMDVRFPLSRTVDLRKRGWYSGDSHAHMIHGENTLPVTFDDVALAARAEDLQYLCVAQAWTMEAPNPARLEAELQRRSTADCVLTWNLEAPKNYYRGDAGRCLGHCWTLGMRGEMPTGDNLIQVLAEASAHDYESDKPTFANFESHELIHAQGGIVSYSHPARWWSGTWGGKGGFPRRELMRISNMAVELPLDVLVGPTFDGIDLITGPGEFEANAKAFELWCLLLNHGYRFAGTGSSDSCFDRVGGGNPGVPRLYTYVKGKFSISAVAHAAAQGQNFVTTGPLLLASIDGKPPGSRFRANGKARTLSLEAWASGQDAKGLTGLELLRNGVVIQTNLFRQPMASIRTGLGLPADTQDAWYCVRVFGSDHRRQRAISGAFFVESANYRPPAPLQPVVRVRLLDTDTGAPLTGTVTEVQFAGTKGHHGKRHGVRGGEARIMVRGTVRLRAEAKGYSPQMLSPFLNSAMLVERITTLSDKDLLNWDTYEWLRQEYSAVELVFRLRKE